MNLQWLVKVQPEHFHTASVGQRPASPLDAWPVVRSGLQRGSVSLQPPWSLANDLGSATTTSASPLRGAACDVVRAIRCPSRRRFEPCKGCSGAPCGCRLYKLSACPINEKCTM